MRTNDHLSIINLGWLFTSLVRFIQIDLQYPGKIGPGVDFGDLNAHTHTRAFIALFRFDVVSLAY